MPPCPSSRSRCSFACAHTPALRGNAIASTSNVVCCCLTLFSEALLVYRVMRGLWCCFATSQQQPCGLHQTTAPSATAPGLLWYRFRSNSPLRGVFGCIVSSGDIAGAQAHYQRGVASLQRAANGPRGYLASRSTAHGCISGFTFPGAGTCPKSGLHWVSLFHVAASISS